MFLAEAGYNLISKFRNFKNLNTMHLVYGVISSMDFEKISTFNNLKKVTSYMSAIDFKGFCNKNVTSISLHQSTIKNLEALAECKSLKNLTIYDSTVYDNYIIKENNNYILKGSSIFMSFDYVENLYIGVDKIEDISGILEMDSLEIFHVNKDSISEEDVKLLEDKGVKVTYSDYKN